MSGRRYSGNLKAFSISIVARPSGRLRPGSSPRRREYLNLQASPFGRGSTGDPRLSVCDIVIISRRGNRSSLQIGSNPNTKRCSSMKESSLQWRSSSAGQICARFFLRRISLACRSSRFFAFERFSFSETSLGPLHAYGVDLRFLTQSTTCGQSIRYWPQSTAPPSIGTDVRSRDPEPPHRAVADLR